MSQVTEWNNYKIAVGDSQVDNKTKKEDRKIPEESRKKSRNNNFQYFHQNKN